MTEIAILGSGRAGTKIGTKLAAAGHKITFVTRDPAQVREGGAGPQVGFAEPAEAIRSAEVVINTTPGATTLDRLTALRSELAGRVLVDLANATEPDPNGVSTRLLCPNSSLAEQVAQQLPETRAVKTLNTMLFLLMTDPAEAGTASTPTVFLSGDAAEAKSLTRGLLNDLGWPDEWIEDLGGIASARGPEAFMLFVPHLARSHGMIPFGLSLAVAR